ncbi:MAG TPA: hypothetical protein DHV28_08990 [Ignavibacteriales bacterium]|nr:hypothetical protein [Ignavibacteriales bacterium]
MKNLSIKLILFVILALTVFNPMQAQNTSSKNDNEVIMTETNQYLKRVNLDNGNILNKTMLNGFIKLTVEDNWINDLKFWTSAQWGLKEYLGNIAKQYDFRGNDLTNTSLDRRPKKIEMGNIYGVKYDGIDDSFESSDFSVMHPMSLLMVFSCDDITNKIALLDNRGSKNHLLSLEKNESGDTQLKISTAGDVYVKGIKKGINIVYVEFNIKNSKVYLNGELAFSGIIGIGELNGLVIGRGKINSDVSNFNGVMFETGIINNTLSDDSRTHLINLMKETYNVQ